MMACISFGKLKSHISTFRGITADLQWPETSITTEDAPWRLETETEVLCTCESAVGENGPIAVNLPRLLEKKVIKASVNPVSMDLELVFEEGFRLLIFCTQFGPCDETYSHYTIKADNRYYTVKGSGRIDSEPQTPTENRLAE